MREPQVSFGHAHRVKRELRQASTAIREPLPTPREDIAQDANRDYNRPDDDFTYFKAQVEWRRFEVIRIERSKVVVSRVRISCSGLGWV